MFHCFHRQTVKVPKRTPAKLIAILPLHSNHIAVLDESQTITLYKLPSGKAVSHLQLPFKPRRWAIASPDSIVLLAAEERSVYEVLIWEESYRLVTHFQPSHHYNTQQVILREKEYFSTMALTSFNSSVACFLREERMEERKLRLHFL
jgi:hypothetical protein